MNIQLTKKDLARCTEFAEACVGTNKDEYARRGQSKRATIVKQIITGKLGELAVAKHLGLDDPDFEIYSKSKKSYAKDLEGDGYHYHVKTQDVVSAEKYGTSWIFQVRDRLVAKPTDLDKIVCCTVDLSSLNVNIYAIINAEKVVGLYKPTKLGFPSKCALYAEDLNGN